MASSRDDFIIAIRSAFLKKSTKQKFSLLTLVFISIFTIVLSNLDLKLVRILKIAINEIVYRSSFVVSVPENFLKKSAINIFDYATFYNKYKKDQIELKNLKSKNTLNEIILFENIELKNLINDYVSSSDKILAKIIVDHQSPFLKSIIINKGSKDNIKIGTNIYDQSYLVGRVIEVNYKTSRVLLLSDLNSNVPVTIAPQNVQAIITGTGENNGEIKYIKDGLANEFTNESTIYTSGTGAIFKSGIPIGKVRIIENDKKKNFLVDFFSDFTQLKYVFAEIVTKVEVKKDIQNQVIEDQNKINPLDAKLKILEDEKKIIEESNIKFKDENDKLKNSLSILKNDISRLKDEINIQKNVIQQFEIDKKELDFLKLNLEYGHKCRKTFLNNKGYIVGSSKYKRCVLNKGRKIND